MKVVFAYERSYSAAVRALEAANLPVFDRGRAIAALSPPPPGEVPPEADRSFEMVNSTRLFRLTEALRVDPAVRNYKLVFRALLLLIAHLRPRTDELSVLHRDLAEQLGCTPDNLTVAMSHLARYGVIVREYPRPPAVVYRFNPHVAFEGGSDARSAAQLDWVVPPACVAVRPASAAA